MRNVLTIDVEDWYQTNGFNIPIENWGNFRDRVVVNTQRLLDVLDKNRVHATFFILGCVAQKYPDLVLDIARQGHEVGSHGGWHRLVSQQTLEEFRQDLLFSKHTLERILNKPVTLYRAPSWSISPNRFRVLEILSEEGFVCDSSIQPFRTPLSGIAGAPLVPFYPIVEGKRLDILEFPPTVLNICKMRIPFSGGFYLRAAPYAMISWALSHLNKTRPGMIYIHPWELDRQHPRLNAAPSYKRFIHYFNMDSTHCKLNRLLNEFEFGSLGEVIKQGSYPALSLS
ncbi:MULTISPECIES: DUF3473 domain-containing protein [unclassified Paenibacillus]|uniref:DUF3473 domain-containing protein n=1 Tax=unclassified Paenibacillus TaxID=185978 RepID=UPI001AE83E93|nr:MULTISPECIES: DUF3473 domain-containing protein [unclassified Paenibacillus]MBP1154246.1 polysaccharide deacetylase family protein (PEP-CTERM system associated) [Paenibacillus sp. PvP091]MBP1170369.1 polysaccharide deacetylase family protein (PEP-CTERM system associated) [Paenibacillus sp. PvR098]MBP2441397.1 polysaccharide deacetylase family protein (PEP-CTERM system associated) [Paenibacillus sp. PvP052]